jgi:hypothetical membrane protein
MRHRLLMLCGILAPAVYVATVILGGILRLDYSQKAQAVSELIEAGVPNKWLLNPSFAIYNLLTGAFGLGLFMTVRASRQTERRLVGSLGALALVFEAVLGFVTLFFPQDPRGAAPTFTGATHIVLAGLSSLATAVTILLMGLWFRKAPGLRGYGTYSFGTVVIILITGGLAAWAVPTGNPFAGVFERLVIGTFLQWLVVIALKMYQSEASGSPG